MKNNPLSSITRTQMIWSAILIILCTLYLVWTLGLLSGARLDVPFTYDGDGLEYNLLTKTMIENGWWLENPMTGAPGTLELYDYPIGSNLDLLIMKFISLFSGNYAVVMNVYYILGFFLTGLCSLYVFRALRIAYPIAVFGSLLFSFLYYHFFRISHYNLTAYYMIPLMILVILWVCQGESLFCRNTGKRGLFSGLTLTHKGLIAIFFLLITSTHPYYGFFGLLLLAVATLWSYSRTYHVSDFLNGAIACVVLMAGIVLNKLPSLVYGLLHGPSFVMSYRYAFESETWGMKLIQLLLPAQGHRIPFLADIAQQYTQYRPLVNENVSASLGIIGSIGLVITLGWIFIRGFPLIQAKLAERAPLVDHLSLLTFASILIGTIGGISAIIAQVFPDIHSYNRISLFIAFFGILIVLLLLQLVFEQYRTLPLFCPLFLILLLVLLTAGIFDQVPAGYALTPGSDREKEFQMQADYFGQIEQKMPAGSSIFILPDIGGFPNSNPPGKIKGLDSLKPYLHTHNLKWSYPTMKGRFWDNWQTAVCASTPEDMVGHLFATGFTGMLIDGYGYVDGGAATEATIQNLTGVSPMMSTDGRYAFYDLTSYMNQKKAGMNAAQFETAKQEYISTMMARSELQNPYFGSEVREKLTTQ
ncbi:MAG: hypothetical protein LUQ50_01680 [Methanospirillum sp.]|uniref:hypothetical protein n=1 Tax=Methanospirillum sp. TaxID=45200 RepID=UPI00236D6AFE|nr:hypothetical protein [Methanospirillum sp.]MDD1727763.1 hypothetical protein [Methanospirillum sp.]